MKSLSATPSLLAGAVALLSINGALAKAPAANSEQVIVSATRSEQSSVLIPTNIVKINAEEIERSGARSLTDLLRSRAGIQVQDTVGSGSRGSTLSMRGFGSNAANNTLVLLDGHKLNQPSLAAPDLSSIAIADIERIEIIQGSAGVLFGDQATGGVINIITKRPENRAGNIEAGFGNEDREFYRGGISEAFDNGFAYRLSAEKSLSDNYRDNNETSYGNILGRAGYTHAMFSGFIEAQQVNDNMRLPGALSPQLIDENRRQTTTDSDFTNIDTDRYRVGGEAAINQQWKFAAEYSYRSSDSTGVFFSTQFADATTVKSFTPRAIGNVELPYGVLVATVGYDYQSAEYKSNLTFNHVEQDTDDVYGQLVIPIYRDITATTGLRHSRIEQKNITASATKDDSETLRTLGLAWQADSALRIFARYDRNFRWANADENGYTLPGVTFLKPQTSDSYEAGINWKQGSLEVDVVLFRLNTDNELLFDPAAGFFGANINLEHSRRDGLSTELRWAVLDNVVLRASAAHVDAEVRAGNFKGKQVPFVAEQNASVGIDWKIGALFTVYADAQYTGRRFRSGDDPNIVGELGGHTIYNTGVRAQLDQWYVTLRVNNVTQKEYEGFSGVFISGFGNFEYAYPAAERQTWLSAGYKF